METKKGRKPMANIFDTFTDDDILEKYETVISFQLNDLLEDEKNNSDEMTNLIVSEVEDEEYQNIEGQHFEVPTEDFEHRPSDKAKIEATRYKGTTIEKINFIEFVK